MRLLTYFTLLSLVFADKEEDEEDESIYKVAVYNLD